MAISHLVAHLVIKKATMAQERIPTRMTVLIKMLLTTMAVLPMAMTHQSIKNHQTVVMESLQLLLMIKRKVVPMERKVVDETRIGASFVH